VVLEIEADTRKIDNGFDTSLSELLWVANARSLEDKR